MGEKVTNPIHKALLQAAAIDEQDRQNLEDSNVALVAALRGVVLCLTEHLSQEAHDSNVTVEVLCPCSEGELKVARELLEKVDEKKLQIERH